MKLKGGLEGSSEERRLSDLGFWRWLGKVLLKKVRNREVGFFMASVVALFCIVILTRSALIALVGTIVWLTGWILYIIYTHYKEFVEAE